MFMETAGRHYRSDFILAAVERLRPIAADLGLTMPQLALAWVLRRQEISAAIIGASRPEQITENVRAIGVTLPQAALDLIDEAVSSAAVFN
jgi:aryl-alcohol dehydrogenase-like predicted oxidoreductase